MLTTHFRYCLLTIVIAVLVPLNISFELPFLKTCTFKDEQCHVEQVNKFVELYGNGIEELDVPPMDPMHLGNITIEGNSNPNFNLQMFMENVELYKFPNLKCLSVKGFIKDDSKPMRVVVTAHSDQLKITTRCRIKGKLMIFNVDGETDLIIDTRNDTTVMQAFCSPYKKDGRTYYKVDELKPRINIGSLKTSFKNSTLFNGEQIFMDTFAETINANWEILRDEIEPHINGAVERVLIKSINKVLATIPYDQFFKDSKTE